MVGDIFPFPRRFLGLMISVSGLIDMSRGALRKKRPPGSHGNGWKLVRHLTKLRTTEPSSITP